MHDIAIGYVSFALTCGSNMMAIKGVLKPQKNILMEKFKFPVDCPMPEEHAIVNERRKK